MNELFEDFNAWSGGIDADDESIEIYIEYALIEGYDEDTARSELKKWAEDGCPMDDE